MNTRLTKYLSALILLAATALDLSAENRKAITLNKVTFVEQQLEISIEIASSKAQRELGLMHRTSLGEKQGMLFVFPNQAPRGVWMKNTLLPLDVLFLSADGRIVSMFDNLQPCPNDPCPIYNSPTPATYMLELNAHFIQNHHLKAGQQLRLT